MVDDPGSNLGLDNSFDTCNYCSLSEFVLHREQNLIHLMEATIAQSLKLQELDKN